MRIRTFGKFASSAEFAIASSILPFGNSAVWKDTATFSPFGNSAGWRVFNTLLLFSFSFQGLYIGRGSRSEWFASSKVVFGNSAETNRSIVFLPHGGIYNVAIRHFCQIAIFFKFSALNRSLTPPIFSGGAGREQSIGVVKIQSLWANPQIEDLRSAICGVH